MTRVRFPTTIRLTLTEEQLADPELPAVVLDATGAALSRAVQKAYGLDLVASPRGTDVDLPAPRFEISFSGDRLPEDIERRLRIELTGLVRAQGLRLLSGADRSAGPAKRLSDEAGSDGELFDSLRLVSDPRLGGDGYLVPYYDRDGKHAPFRMEGNPKKKAEAEPKVILGLRRFESEEYLRVALLAAVAGRGVRQLVAIWGAPDGEPVGAYVEFGRGGITGFQRLPGWKVFAPAKGEPWVPARNFALSADRLVFKTLGATLDECSAIRVEEILRELRTGVLEPPQPHASEAQLRAHAKKLADELPPPPSHGIAYYELFAHGRRIMLIEADADLLPHMELQVLVFTSEYDVEDLEEQKREDCPPLGTSTGGLFSEAPAEAGFLDEPPVEFWPTTQFSLLSDMVAGIAGQLDILPGRFPARFLMDVARTIESRAGNLGTLEGSGVRGTESPRLTRMRKLAAVFAPMAQLEQFYTRLVLAADEDGTLECPLRGQTPSWVRQFYEAYNEVRDDAVGTMFKATCQDLLLENLEQSHYELVRRLNHFDAYMKITRQFILLVLLDTTELMNLRVALQAASVGMGDVVGIMSPNPIDAWVAAANATVKLLQAPPIDTSGPPRSGRVASFADGMRVQDSMGRWWSASELDAVIATGRQQAFAVDPFLEKLDDLPDTVRRLRTAGIAGIDDEFWKLLNDILAENVDRTADARDDADVAFGLATMKEDLTISATAIGADLSGIHALADERLRPLFVGEGNYAYVAGMRYLTGIVVSKEKLISFLNIVGLTALAIFFPEAAFVIGAIEAGVELHTAIEHRGIQRAMLGGDEILSKAQVEAELWGAAIGAALVFIPEVPGLVRGGSRAVTAIAEGELRETASVAARQLAKQAAERITKMAAEGLVKSFAKEALKAYVLNLALEHAVGAITDAVAREASITGHAGLGDIGEILTSAISGDPSDASTAPALPSVSAAAVRAVQ